jgi:hypothetical protein
MSDTARVVAEVSAGIIPGTPDPEHSRRWAITSQAWHDAADTPHGQMEALALLNGQASGYAALLMLQPDRVNWVRTDWIYL